MVQSEADIYPLVYAILASIASFNRNFQIVSKHFEEISPDHIQEAAEALSSATQERLCQEKEASENEEYSSSKELLQTTHADDIVKVYLAMERWFKDHLALRVRAEMVVVGPRSRTSCAVFEVISGNVFAGFYQCAAHLVLASREPDRSSPIVWGVCTTLEKWVFLRLEGNQIRTSNSMLFCSGFRSQIVDEFKALQILGFLFEMFEIPEDVIMNSTMNNSNNNSNNNDNTNKEFADAAIAYLAIFLQRSQS